jgi:DNA-binding winged helix-turn-helix (wHTH) protein
VPLRDNICVGDLEVRSHERAVLVQGTSVSLTPGEFDILRALAEHPGWVFSADQLSSDPDDGHSPESVSVLVSRLRQKLAAAGVADAVDTVRGFGYRLHADPASSVGDSRAADEASNALREAAWHLQEAAIEVEHTGSPEQQIAAAGTLEQARHVIYAHLAK